MVYDLIEPEHKNFWCGMTTFDEDGNILSNMVNVAQAVNKPKDHVLSSRDERIGIKWFDTRAQAQAFALSLE